jgi:FAD/FMN-containing dehydrogenase
MERIRFSALEEFFELSALSDRDYEYTVAWVDCLARGKKLGRGIFIRGNHLASNHPAPKKIKKPRTLRVPFDLPAFFLNSMAIRAFNISYYHSQLHKKAKKVVHYEPFFYPLDVLLEWNRMYGRRGFLQYQCVVPYDDDYKAIREILTRIACSGRASFLTVLKTFGALPSPGMLSFPTPGVTLALDFPYHGEKTLQLLDKLDEIVRTNGGVVYPAKDARMSAESFQTYYPQWREFARFIDPKFSSSFWRRVTREPTYDLLRSCDAKGQQAL